MRTFHEVASLARGVGATLGLDAEALDELTRAPEMHDTGGAPFEDEPVDDPGRAGLWPPGALVVRAVFRVRFAVLRVALPLSRSGLAVGFLVRAVGLAGGPIGFVGRAVGLLRGPISLFGGAVGLVGRFVLVRGGHRARLPLRVP